VAGALVLYDRLLQHGRFAERPVASGGASQPKRLDAAADSHGSPVFRAMVPDWLKGGGKA